MGMWSGPFLIAAVLLAGAGAAKVVDPTMTVGALRGIGVRLPPIAVRGAGACELVLAIAAALTGVPALAVMVGISYVAFTVFVVVAITQRAPIGSCGCFGKVDTPPSVIHIVVNLAAAFAAFMVATRDGGNLWATLDHQPLEGVPLLLLVAVGAYAAFAALTVVPQLLHPARE